MRLKITCTPLEDNTLHFCLPQFEGGLLRQRGNKKMNKSRLLVVGSLNMDLVVDVPYMPKVGETILGYGFKTIPGGKGANQAYAAAKLGGETYMLGCVGSDGYGQILIDNLRSVGVKTESIEKQKGLNTGVAFIYVNKEGDNNIVVVPGANSACTKSYIDKHKELIEYCDIVMLQCEIPIDAVAYTIEIARKLNKTIILDPAPAPDHLPESILEKIDIIKPNESELQKLTGKATDTIDDIKEAANILLAKGVKSVVVTWGGKGAVLVEDNKYRHYPVAAVKVVDTTAAGDSFTAALAVAISEGKSLDEAIKFANAVSTIVVTRPGAQTSIPSRAEVEGLS